MRTQRRRLCIRVAGGAWQNGRAPGETQISHAAAMVLQTGLCDRIRGLGPAATVLSSHLVVDPALPTGSGG